MAIVSKARVADAVCCRLSCCWLDPAALASLPAASAVTIAGVMVGLPVLTAGSGPLRRLARLLWIRAGDTKNGMLDGKREEASSWSAVERGFGCSRRCVDQCWVLKGRELRA